MITKFYISRKFYECASSEPFYLVNFCFLNMTSNSISVAVYSGESAVTLSFIHLFVVKFEHLEAFGTKIKKHSYLE
jgi:hypothetical protein